MRCAPTTTQAPSLASKASCDRDGSTPFWPYVSWWVRQAMQRLVAELTRPVVLSDRALRQLARLKDAYREHLHRDGLEPTVADLAASTGLSRDQVSRSCASATASRGPSGACGRWPPGSASVPSGCVRSSTARSRSSPPRPRVPTRASAWLPRVRSRRSWIRTAAQVGCHPSQTRKGRHEAAIDKEERVGPPRRRHRARRRCARGGWARRRRPQASFSRRSAIRRPGGVARGRRPRRRARRYSDWALPRR